MKKTSARSESREADQQNPAGERTDTKEHAVANHRGGYVGYDAGPDREALSARYGMDVAAGEARTLQRLESDFGTDRVEQWAEEGMPVATMGKPRDMAAFRERQAGRPEEVPTDVERRNAASVRRNAAHNQESGAAGDARVPEAVRRVVSSPGRSLDEPVQREMESKMGGEFGDVRVHTGPRAAAAAEAIDARAFTVGSHVAFNEGEYRPTTEDGKRVLAHELTHVRQQTDGAVSLLPEDGADRRGTATPVGGSVHVQPTLEVSSPDDPAEREAERVAEAVVAMDDATGGRNETDGTDDPDVAVRSSNPPGRSSSDVGLSETAETAVREGVRGGGRPLPPGTRSEFEEKMGADFSDVRVHTGPSADEAARSIDAEAYTTGSDIAFAKGNYEPASTAGQELLAHELTHVLQQSRALRARIQRQSQEEEDSGDQSAENGDDSDSGEDSACDDGGPTRPEGNWLPSGWKEQTYELSGDSCADLEGAWQGEKPACPNTDCEGYIEDMDPNVAATTCYCLDYDPVDTEWNFPQNGPYIRETNGKFEPEVKEFEITTGETSVSFEGTPVVIMPEWPGYEDADDPVKCAWNSFVRDLREHEHAHVDKVENENEKEKITEKLNETVDEWEKTTETEFPEEIEGMSAKTEDKLKQKIRQKLDDKFPDSDDEQTQLDREMAVTFDKELARVNKEQGELHGNEIDGTETLDCP